MAIMADLHKMAGDIFTQVSWGYSQQQNHIKGNRASKDWIQISNSTQVGKKKNFYSKKRNYPIGENY
jgi:hypothetical protein